MDIRKYTPGMVVKDAITPGHTAILVKRLEDDFGRAYWKYISIGISFEPDKVRFSWDWENNLRKGRAP